MKIDLNDFILTPEGTQTIWRWSDALKQRLWDSFADPDELIMANIQVVASRLMEIRMIFPAYPLAINSWLRTPEYNKLIGGALNSAHLTGEAVDFVVVSVDCDLVRERLLIEIERLGLRMENKPRAPWIHIDTRAPNPNRYFIP